MDLQFLKEFRNRHNPFARQLGIIIEEISPGHAKVTKTVTAEDLNPLQLAHGGVYCSMADTACGSAAASHGFQAVTLSANYNYFRSAQVGDFLTAEARESKSGRTICVYEVTITDQDGQLLGSGTFTFYLLDKKLEVGEASTSG